MGFTCEIKELKELIITLQVNPLLEQALLRVDVGGQNVLIATLGAHQGHPSLE